MAGFLSAGRDLDVLLRKRADHESPDRSNAGTLRGATLGLLNRFRDALADEFDQDADALAKADRALFAYFDELEKRRATAAASPADTNGDAPVTPVTPKPA